MDFLARANAPLSARVWELIDQAVKREATHVLAARRVADFEGPRGWDFLAVPTGSVRPLTPPSASPAIAVPELAPLLEIRAEFAFPMAAVWAVEQRGAPLDTEPAEEAARTVALAEDRLALLGEPQGAGFLSASASPRVGLGDWAQPGQVVADVLGAVAALDGLGIGGPYALVLSPDRYYAYQRAVTTGGGYPAARHLTSMVGHVHRSKVVASGALFSLRGGDCVLVVGGDLSVGYTWHDPTTIRLFCVETLAARLLEPRAVCLLGAP